MFSRASKKDKIFLIFTLRTSQIISKKNIYINIFKNQNYFYQGYNEFINLLKVYGTIQTNLNKENRKKSKVINIKQNNCSKISNAIKEKDSEKKNNKYDILDLLTKDKIAKKNNSIHNFKLYIHIMMYINPIKKTKKEKKHEV